MLEHDPVTHADEARDIFRGRLLEDALRGVELLDYAVAHDGKAIAQGQRLSLVVCHENGGVAETGVQLVQMAPDVVAQPRVEVAERLVEQHEFRPRDETARESYTLLLSSAELTGVTVEQPLAVHQLERLVGPTLMQALSFICRALSGYSMFLRTVMCGHSA